MKILLLVMLPLLGVAQTVSKNRMDIVEQWEGYHKCHEDIPVVWGKAEDTIFFIYDSRVLRLWQPKYIPLELAMHVDNLIVRHPKDIFKVLEDKNSNLYVIRIVNFDGPFVIYLTGITDKMFNIYFDFTSNKICTK